MNINKNKLFIEVNDFTLFLVNKVSLSIDSSNKTSNKKVLKIYNDQRKRVFEKKMIRTIYLSRRDEFLIEFLENFESEIKNSIQDQLVNDGTIIFFQFAPISFNTEYYQELYEDEVNKNVIAIGEIFNNLFKDIYEIQKHAISRKYITPPGEKETNQKKSKTRGKYPYSPINVIIYHFIRVQLNSAPHFPKKGSYPKSRLREYAKSNYKVSPQSFYNNYACVEHRFNKTKDITKIDFEKVGVYKDFKKELIIIAENRKEEKHQEIIKLIKSLPDI